MRRLLFILALLAAAVFGAFAQEPGSVVYQGYVRDSASGEPLPMASIVYKGTVYGTETDVSGFYVLSTDRLWSDKLEVSYLGYKTKVIDLRKRGKRLNIKLSPDDEVLGEVVVTSKRRERYRRKDNPAVELMRKVIAHKDSADIRSNDYYQNRRYEKVIIGLNDIKAPKDSAKKAGKRWNFMYDFTDTSEISGKAFLPITVRENVSDVCFQRFPRLTKRTVTAQNNRVMLNVMSEDMIDNLINECYTDVQLYNNNIDLFVEKFMSPLSSFAITFYHFYINDTVTFDDGKRYIEMTFAPSNSSDLGFAGFLYVSTDGSYAVRKVKMDIPRDIKLNVVDRLHIEQEFEPVGNGQWAISHEKMVSELSLIEGLQGGYMRRDAYFSNYRFGEQNVDMSAFDRQENIYVAKTAKLQADTFWARSRPQEVRSDDARLDSLAKKFDEDVLFNILEYTIRMVIEGYMPIGRHEYFDYGPVMSTYSRNDLEGNRFRIGGRTNPALNDRLFFDGYLAYGTDDEKLKYKGELEYSFRDRKFSKMDFPRHSIMANYRYDWDIPSERYMGERNTSFIHGFRRHKVRQFAYVREQNFRYIHERGSGFSFDLGLRHAQETPAMELEYRHLDGSRVPMLEQSYLSLNIGYAPGVHYYQNKSSRYVLNRDVPQFGFNQTASVRDFLGTQYDYHKTELSYRQKYNVTPLGYFLVCAKVGKVWNKVPYPLLFVPPASLSYINTDETFWLMNNMEFLTDQYTSLDVFYNMNGFLLGRIPGVRRLHWKEVFRFKALMGDLTKKNDPSRHTSDNTMFALPADRMGNPTSFRLEDNKPYMEVSVGLHNVFKFFMVEFVRRLNYLDNPNVSKWGITAGVGLYM